MKTIIFPILFTITFCTKAFTENIQLRIKDPNSKKDVRINLNSKTGQYTLRLEDMYEPKRMVDPDELKMCNWIENHLAENKDTHPQALKGMFSKKRINFQIFRNFRETPDLEKLIQSKLKREGVQLDKLTNLTDARIRDIKIQSMNWDHSALSVTNKDLLATSEQAISNMIEGSVLRSKVYGPVATSTDLDYLYCDLLNEKLDIQFSLSVEQFEYFDDKVVPLKPALSSIEIKKLSDELARKRVEITDLTESSLGQQRRKDNYIYSLIYLYRELTKENNDIKYLKAIGFAKLATELIDPHSGLSRNLNSDQIEKIELSLYTGQIKFRDFEEIELEGKL